MCTTRRPETGQLALSSNRFKSSSFGVGQPFSQRCCNVLETKLALVQQAISIQSTFCLLQISRRERPPVPKPGTHDPLSRGLHSILPKQKLCNREMYPLSCAPGSILIPSLEESSGISQASNIRGPSPQMGGDLFADVRQAKCKRHGRQGQGSPPSADTPILQERALACRGRKFYRSLHERHSTSSSTLEAVQRNTACALLSDRETLRRHLATARAHMCVERRSCNLLCSTTLRQPGRAAARVHSKRYLLQAYAPRSCFAARVGLEKRQHFTMYPERLSDVVPLHGPDMLSRQV